MRFSVGKGNPKIILFLREMKRSWRVQVPIFLLKKGNNPLILIEFSEKMEDRDVACI
jgi:hypothetical protein